MHEWLTPGKRVRVRRPSRFFPDFRELIVERYPVKGLYHDYVLCREKGRAYYFLPEELASSDP